MSRNIKEIGKELMGKSLNSFHRKIGLTQLEKNNEMQDGILDGILSQVNDAYIEKTEQSNVIHLEGSGDGVVVLDGIEGNTMVNLFKGFDVYKSNHFETISKTKLKMVGRGYYPTIYYKDYILKPNTKYTLIVNVDKLDIEEKHNQWVILRVGDNTNGTNVTIPNPITVGKYVTTFTTPNVSSINNLETYMRPEMTSDNIIELSNMMILEGDWTNKEIPPYFEDLQSSFEEKVNNEGKYEIEILSNNKCLNKVTSYKSTVREYTTGYVGVVKIIERNIKVNPNETYTLSYTNIGDQLPSPPIVLYSGKPYPENASDDHNEMYSFCSKNKGNKYAHITTNGGYGTIGNNGHLLNKTFHFKDIKLEKGTNSGFVPHKQNKIKLLINEPLRATKHGKDIMCVKNGKLMVERNCRETILNGSENWNGFATPSNGTVSYSSLRIANLKVNNGIDYLVCDKFPTVIGNQHNYNREMIYTWSNGAIYIHITTSKLSTQNIQGFKTWLQNNPVKVVYQLEEPVYEEVLNEYGEPIILEGYENGTLYIDSTIVPTTTVRYTPTMESFKTLNEVSDNNTMLANDINDNIIPYMMDVDLMIMEKEMALMNQINIRKMEVLDMTSMQKRTQDMLERLIKGKTLTEQECKTRITTYLNAGKITDAQAEELNFLIDEIYA